MGDTFDDGFEASRSLNPQFVACHLVPASETKLDDLKASAQLRWHLQTIQNQRDAKSANAWLIFSRNDCNRQWPVLDTLCRSKMLSVGDKRKVPYVVSGVVPCYLPTNADTLDYPHFDVLTKTADAPSIGTHSMAWWLVKMKGRCTGIDHFKIVHVTFRWSENGVVIGQNRSEGQSVQPGRTQLLMSRLPYSPTILPTYNGKPVYRTRMLPRYCWFADRAFWVKMAPYLEGVYHQRPDGSHASHNDLDLRVWVISNMPGDAVPDEDGRITFTIGSEDEVSPDLHREWQNVSIKDTEVELAWYDIKFASSTDASPPKPNPKRFLEHGFGVYLP